MLSTQIERMSAKADREGINVKGLLRNNFYMVCSNIALFSVIMLFMGIFVLARNRDVHSWMIVYMLLGMIGFSAISMTGIRRESACKWSKYKLTTPVKRSDIVKSYFLSQLLWLFSGMLFSAFVILLFILLHGFVPFDKNTDAFMVYVVGIGCSLFMESVFFPLFCVGGEGKNEIFLIVSLFCGIFAIMGLSTLWNNLLGTELDTFQIILGGTAILVLAAAAFTLSYFLTVYIYKRKEF